MFSDLNILIPKILLFIPEVFVTLFDIFIYYIDILFKKAKFINSPLYLENEFLIVTFYKIHY